MRDTADDVAIRSEGDLVVAAGWQAVEVWLEGVRHNAGDYSQETATTYSYHVAKLRWYCNRIPPVPI